MKRRNYIFVTALLLLTLIAAAPFNSLIAQKGVLIIGKSEALGIAEKYYRMASQKIESDLAGEFRNNAGFIPSFEGTARDSLKCLSYSLETAGMISFTGAKNYYLALASAVFPLDYLSSNAALNLASAIACYYDDSLTPAQSNKSLNSDFYNDAIKMYSYSVICSSAGGGLNKLSVPALNCLANLYLDLKKTEDAFTLFSESFRIDPDNYSTIMGLYNCYMAQKQYDKALKLLMDNMDKAPVFARAVSKLTKSIPADDGADQNGGSEEEIAKVSTIPAATTADFIEDADPAAARQIRKDVEAVQNKMKIKAPDIDYLLMIKNYPNMSGEIGLSALTAIADQMKELELSTVGYETEAVVEKNLEMLKNLGVDVQANFDIQNIQKLVDDAIKNPSKYENFNPDVKISGLSGLNTKAMEYGKKVNKAAAKAVRGDAQDLFKELAKTNPEFKIMAVNPYKYANTNDILIQRFNVLAYSKKMNAYRKYLSDKLISTAETINDLTGKYTGKIYPLIMEYQEKLIQTAKIEDEDRRKVAIHRLHTGYFPRFNNIGQPFWNQATEAAAIAYKKIEKYAPLMYKDCIKHIMLISDFEIRDKMEKDLTGFVMQTIKTGMQNSLRAYSFAPYYDPALCDCDLEEIRELKEKIDRETEELANEQIRKNMIDKKNFEQGVLDENSNYYKDFIAKYEYEVNLIFVKEKVSPYKSSFSAGIDLSMFGINYSTFTNHHRNTTTYDGNISFGGEVAGGSIKSTFGFSATKGSDGKFSPKDIDVRASVEGGINIGVVNLTGGAAASALRGTRVYANAGITSDKYLDDFKKKEKLEWLPGIGKEVWSGSYSEEEQK